MPDDSQQPRKRRTKCVLSIAGLFVVVVAPVSLATPQCREHWYMVSVYAGKDQPVVFYGRVVDQQGKPIAGATVWITVQGFDPKSLTGSRTYMSDREFTRTTGADGSFSVEGIRANVLYVKKVAHPDYVTIPERKWKTLLHVDYFPYARDRGAPYYIPDANSPAIFPLRREGEQRVMWPQRGGRDEPNRW